MEQERRDILELPVVSGISDMVNGKGFGFRVNLRCHTARHHGTCKCGGLKRGVPVYVSPPVVSVCKGILTAYSFLFFGTPRHYTMRKYSCWCRACSRVRGRGPGNGTVSRGAYLDVPNCARNKLTVWREDHFTVQRQHESSSKRRGLLR